MAKKKSNKPSNNYFDFCEIEPLTDTQEEVFNSTKNLILAGSAGTGKTFISVYLALQSILVDNEYRKLVVVRSAVPTRDMGFLPGDDKEKAKIYEIPYISICSDLLQRGDAYSILRGKNKVDFMTTSYLRGVTLRNSVVIVDECQNLSFHELDTIITRIGHNCRIIFCGDFYQADLKNNGMGDFLKIVKKMKNQFDVVEFTTKDIVRSDFVKDYLITKEEVLNY